MSDRHEQPGRKAHFLPGLGSALVRVAQKLGMFAPYAPDAHWHAGDPFEQVRVVERLTETELIAAAIALTLSLDEDLLREHEPRILTLRNQHRPSSNWWQSRLSPSSLPPRRLGPPVRPDVFRIPEPGHGPAPAPGDEGRR